MMERGIGRKKKTLEWEEQPCRGDDDHQHSFDYTPSHKWKHLKVATINRRNTRVTTRTNRYTYKVW